MKRYRFERRGVLALAASAWGQEFDAAQAPAVAQEGPVAVVQIRGPLTHHSDWFCDSYDAIKARVGAALASPAAKVALRITSPGGDVAGCFETATELRAMAARAGKSLHAYADGQASSAAYALACAADSIHLSAETLVGSIGTLAGTVDCTEADAQMGVKFHLFTSGARKADGNPHQPMSEEAAAEIQRQVDEFAELFYAHVCERRGVSVEHVRGMEARQYSGQTAVEKRLADGVTTWSGFLAMVARGGAGGAAAKESRVEYEEMVKALRALAEGDDEEQAKKAKAALVALGEEEAEGEPKKDEGEEKAKAEDEPKKDEKKEEAKAAASAGAPSAATAAAAAVAAENVELKARLDRLEISAMLDKRPDLSAAVRKWCLAQTPDVARSFLEQASKPTAQRHEKASQPKAGPALLEGRERDELDEGMGIRKAGASGPSKDEYGRFTIKVETPAQTRARLAAQKGA
ncbi:S49 family peptidase [Sorangium sp. So ce296]|uniref:S49 family peptidase n=1 Tax=Sorangium sp. So ce296 TaxID=3133296 RepID=UPI003F5D77D4